MLMTDIYNIMYSFIHNKKKEYSTHTPNSKTVSLCICLTRGKTWITWINAATDSVIQFYRAWINPLLIAFTAGKELRWAVSCQ